MVMSKGKALSLYTGVDEFACRCGAFLGSDAPAYRLRKKTRHANTLKTEHSIV